MTELGADEKGKSQNFPGNDEILLGVLTAIERDASTSQRSISRELGVALGLANAYLKRCVTKGLIKIQHVPRRRYAYYLTPHGFAEKTRLTGEYLSASFTFFRRARAQMSEIIEGCEARGLKRIAFAGISELAEVGILCSSDFDVQLVGVLAPGSESSLYRGLPVASEIAKLGAVDAIIVTDLNSAQALYASVVAQFDSDRVFAPRLLRLPAPQMPVAAE